MSWQGSAWAHDQRATCKTPARLLALLVISNHVNPKGSGCFASKETLAEEALMSPRNFVRMTQDLAELGLIVPGDPAFVSHLRRDQRPKVWDLGMAHQPGCTGGHPRDAGCQIVTPLKRSNGVTDRARTGCQTAHERGDKLSPKYKKKNLREDPSVPEGTVVEHAASVPTPEPDGRTDQPSAPQDQEPTPDPVTPEHRDHAAEIVAKLDLSRIGPTRKQLDQVTAALADALATGLDRLQVETHARRKASEAQTVKYFLAGLSAEHMPAVEQARPKRPDWCGECDERTRQRENDQGQSYRCPRCHPLTQPAPRTRATNGRKPANWQAPNPKYPTREPNWITSYSPGPVDDEDAREKLEEYYLANQAF